MKSREKVVSVMASNPSIIVPEIATSLGLSFAGAEKISRALKQKERLRRVGSDKGGHWEIVEK